MQGILQMLMILLSTGILFILGILPMLFPAEDPDYVGGSLLRVLLSLRILTGAGDPADYGSPAGAGNLVEAMDPDSVKDPVGFVIPLFLGITPVLRIPLMLRLLLTLGISLMRKNLMMLVKGAEFRDPVAADDPADVGELTHIISTGTSKVRTAQAKHSLYIP